MSVFRSWSRLMRRVEDSGASRPWTTLPGRPVGLFSEHTNKVLTPPTRAFNDATKPKISLDADTGDEKGNRIKGQDERTEYQSLRTEMIKNVRFIFRDSVHVWTFSPLFISHMFELLLV